MLRFPFASETGVWGATLSDRLHMLQGLINALIVALDSLIRSETPGGSPTKDAREAYLKSRHCELDSRFASISPFVTPDVYMPRFTVGFYGKCQLEAWHATAWLSFIPFLIGDDNAIIKRTETRFVYFLNYNI